MREGEAGNGGVCVREGEAGRWGMCVREGEAGNEIKLCTSSVAKEEAIHLISSNLSSSFSYFVILAILSNQEKRP